MRTGSQQGFTLVELLVVVVIIGIVAATATPGLLRARMSGDEASAIASMRAINSAQHAFATGCASGGFAASLDDLATPPTPGLPAFISPDLGVNGIRKSGYTVTVAAAAGAPILPTTACNGVNPASSYWANAVPVGVGTTGTRSFATDVRGTIFVDDTGAPIANPIPAGTQTLSQ